MPKAEFTISIHASRGGSDFFNLCEIAGYKIISIHASRGGSDALCKMPPAFIKVFQSTLPAGEATFLNDFKSAADPFQSTLPAGEATYEHEFHKPYSSISIHASRGGSDPGVIDLIARQAIFQSTLPAGEATFFLVDLVTLSSTFQSTLPAGEATPKATHSIAYPFISIHASRGGSDVDVLGFNPAGPISIHASRGGSDPERGQPQADSDISIHASRGGSDNPVLVAACAVMISIHASRGGSDVMEGGIFRAIRSISIHASRGGSDLTLSGFMARPWIFQSTLPAGEATGRGKSHGARWSFQSTLPAGEATHPPGHVTQKVVISIHASRGGSDLSGQTISFRTSDFNPRFPRGKRPGEHDISHGPVDFNPRFPRGKRQYYVLERPNNQHISIHASRGGSDHLRCVLALVHVISIHASRGGSDPDKVLAQYDN